MRYKFVHFPESKVGNRYIFDVWGSLVERARAPVPRRNSPPARVASGLVTENCRRGFRLTQQDSEPLREEFRVNKESRASWELLPLNCLLGNPQRDLYVKVLRTRVVNRRLGRSVSLVLRVSLSRVRTKCNCESK